MQDRRPRRPGWQLLRLSLVFFLGAALTMAGAYLVSPFTGGFLLIHNLFRLGWSVADLFGGDGYGLAYLGLTQFLTFLLGGLTLASLVALLDLSAGRVVAGRGRILLWAGAVALFALLLLTPRKPLVIRLSYDSQSAAQQWIDFAQAMQDRNALGRRYALYSSISTHHFPELLTHRAFPDNFEMVILNADFEKAWNPALLQPLEPITRLHSNPVVLATTDPVVAASLEQAPSLQDALQQVEAGEWKLLHLDPAQDAVGLAALVLSAGHSKGKLLLSQDSDRVKVLRPNYGRLIGRSPPYVSPPVRSVDAATADALQEPRSVVILDNARCGELRRAGIPLRGFYPREGTLVLDHPVYMAEGVDPARRERLLHLLTLLESPQGREWKSRTMLASQCADGEPPQVRSAPPLSEVQDLIKQWQEARRRP